MPRISRKNLVAKNKAGNGIRNNELGNNRANNQALKQLAQLLEKATKELGKDLDTQSLSFSTDQYSKSLNRLATTPITKNNESAVENALNRLDGIDKALEQKETYSGKTGYDLIVDILPKIGSSKQEFDQLLKTTNDVLELGLEKRVLAHLDPAAQERLRQEQERQRQEQERQRQEQERLRQEEELRRQEEERVRREQERQRQEQERIRQEQERQRQEALRRREEEEQARREQARLRQEQERQRRDQRIQDIRDQRNAFLNEDYTGTDYENEGVDALKIESDYKEKQDAIEEAEDVISNPRILDGEKEAFRRALNDDALNRRKQDVEEARLMAEDAARNEEPIRQTEAAMVSQELKDSFLKRYPPSETLVARDAHGNEIVGTEAILEKLSSSDTRLFIDIPDDEEHRCMCLQGDEGRLRISTVPVQHGYPDANLVLADPIQEFEDQFDRFYAENGIESAVGADGTVYTTKEAMLKALDMDARLMMFGKDKQYAYGVLNNGGKLQATERADQWDVDPEWVSKDRLPEKTTLYGIDESDILYAVSKDGKRFETPDAIRKEIMNGEGSLRLYTAADKENPYVIDYRNGAAAMSNYPVRESQIDGLEDDQFTAYHPEEMQEKRILNWKESDISYAVDANGKRYDTPDAIKTALYGDDKTLQIFTRSKGEDGKQIDDELPYAVIKKNGRFFISPERVPKFEDQMKVLGKQLSGMEAEDFKNVYRLDGKEFLAKNWTVEESDFVRDKQKALIGLDFSKPRIRFALDEKGNIYDSVDKIAAELDKPDDRTLFVFEKDGDLPYAIQKKDGLFYKSSDCISSKNRMPKSDRYEPKKSLKVDDISGRRDASRYFGLKTQKGDAQKVKQFHEKEIERINKIKEAGRPDPPAQPVRPRLGGWNTFVRGLYKLVTFGRGETDAYRAYTGRKLRYAEDVKTLPERQQKYEKARAEYEKIEQNGDRMLADAREGIENADRRIGKINRELSAAMAEASGGLSAGQVAAYRNRTEVRMEGVADLNKNGRITPDNIFAHTWLKEAECKGKPASDPQARKALCDYLAAEAIQSEILTRRLMGTHSAAQTSDALDMRRVDTLNTGEAADALMKDPDLKKILDDMGGAKMDPRRIKMIYADKVTERNKEARKDSTVLKGAKADMERAFGTQEPTEQAFDEIMRYKRVLKEISNDGQKVYYKNAKEFLAATFAMKPTEEDKTRFREAFDQLKAEGRGPMGLEEMNKVLNEKTIAIEEQKEAARQPGGPQL